MHITEIQIHLTASALAIEFILHERIQHNVSMYNIRAHILVFVYRICVVCNSWNDSSLRSPYKNNNNNQFCIGNNKRKMISKGNEQVWVHFSLWWCSVVYLLDGRRFIHFYNNITLFFLLALLLSDKKKTQMFKWSNVMRKNWIKINWYIKKKSAYD